MLLQLVCLAASFEAFVVLPFGRRYSLVRSADSVGSVDLKIHNTL